MMCTHLQYEDADEDIVVYGDQGISTKKLCTVILRKPEVNRRKKLSIMWPKAQMTVWYWKGKGGDLMKLFPMKIHMMLVRVTLC